MMKKISVLIITYNQEQVIKRTLDSVLQQVDGGLYEIVVNDDCSKDSTWQILKEYETQYPQIVRANRNQTNKGIYGNAWELYSHRGDAELFMFLDGDDILCPGLFSSIQSFIAKNDIDTTGSVGIYFDWKSISPRHNETVYRQDIVEWSGDHPFSLAIRGHVCFRGAVFSKDVLDAYEPVVLDKGLNLAEAMYDFQGIRLAEKYYYIPFVGSAYFTSIGVSKELTSDTAYYNEEDVARWDFFIAHYARNTKDRNWMKACRLRTICKMKFSVSDYLRMCYYYMLGVASYDLKLRKVANFLLLRGYAMYLY